MKSDYSNPVSWEARFYSGSGARHSKPYNRSFTAIGQSFMTFSLSPPLINATVISSGSEVVPNAVVGGSDSSRGSTWRLDVSSA
jgi:hypothetical protein